MSDAPEPSIEELLWTVAMARLAFGPGMSIQAPPNLTPAGPEESTAALEWQALIGAGINDWGGISPVTKDWVNPEVSRPPFARGRRLQRFETTDVHPTTRLPMAKSGSSAP